MKKCNGLYLGTIAGCLLAVNVHAVTLNEATESALKISKSIQSNRSFIKAAQQEVSAATVQLLVPTLDGGYEKRHMQERDTSGTSRSHDSAMGYGLSWHNPLYSYYSLKESKLSRHRSELDKIDDERSLVASVMTTYNSLVEQKQLLKRLNEYLADTHHTYQVVKGKTTGDSADSALVLSAIQLARAHQGVIQASVNDLTSEFFSLVGLAPTHLQGFSTNMNTPTDLDQIKKKVEMHNINILQRKSELAIVENGVKKSWGQLVSPGVSLSRNHSRMTAEGSPHSERETSTSIGFNIGLDAANAPRISQAKSYVAANLAILEDVKRIQVLQAVNTYNNIMRFVK